MQVNGNLDLLKNEIQNARAQNLASAPSNPVIGQFYYDTGSNALRVYSDSGWITLGPPEEAPPSYSDEEARDVVAALIAAGTHLGLDITYDDDGANIGSLTFEVTDSPLLDGEDGAHYLSRANHTGTQSLDTTEDSATRVAMTPAERTKLSGVATGATANDTDANLKNRANHTGTQSLDTTTDSGTRVAMTPAERTKLGGIATGATANDSDANLKNRANHTGTQTVSTISDFTTSVESIVDAAVSEVIDSAPGTLDTLNELAAALGDDPNFATTITNLINAKPDKYAQDFGDGTNTSFAIEHGLNTEDVTVTVRLKATNEIVLCDIVITDADTVTLSGWTTAPTTNAYRVVIVG